MKPIKSASYSLLLLLFNHQLQADALTDGTLGPPPVHLTEPQFTVGEELGQRLGPNLFHSFEYFNIPTGGRATFTGSEGIQNVLARVTGSSISNIDGTLRSTIPHANFYLLNPNGLIFGEHARLDLTGTFYASTAAGIRLGEEGAFLALSPHQSILSVSPPVGFGFLDSPPATIEIHGDSLEIKNQTYYAPNGQINVTVKNELRITDTDTQLSLLERRAQGLPATLDVSGIRGGQIAIQAGQLILDGSSLFADTYQREGLGIKLAIDHDLHLLNGARITADNYGNSQGSPLSITANAIFLSGQNPELLPNDLNSLSTIATNNFAEGHGGNIEINTTQLQLTPGLIQAATDQAGQAGNISIKAQRILMTGLPELQAQLGIHAGAGTEEYGGTGQAGQITIEATNDITLTEFSNISSGTSGSGEGGKINITTPHLTLNQSIINSVSQTTGQAGSISLTANTLSLMAGSHINTEAERAASGGHIELHLKDNLFLFDSTLTTETQGEEGNDNAGNLSLFQPHLFLMDNHSQLFAKANVGKGGNINIIADHFIKSAESPNNAIDASSRLGIDGEVTIDADTTDPTGNLTALPTKYLATLLQPGSDCPESDLDRSRFSVVKQQMLRFTPYSGIRTYSPTPEVYEKYSNMPVTK